MRLPERRPVEIPSSWHHQLYRPCEGEAAVTEVCGLGSFVPPGLIERLLAACYQLGTHRRFWRTGCLLILDVGRHDGGPPVESGATTSGDPVEVDASAARLLVEVEAMPTQPVVGVPVQPGMAEEEGRPVAAAACVAGGGSVVAALDVAEPEYAVRFEAFGAPACEARLAQVVGLAVQLMRGLMKDFSGLIAPAALWPAAAADERRVWY